LNLVIAFSSFPQQAFLARSLSESEYSNLGLDSVRPSYPLGLQ